MATSRAIQLGNVQIGGGAPISVQSMASTDTRDVAATVAQIQEIEAAGADIIRVAVPDMEAAEAIGAIKSQIDIPLVADIHFNYRLAISSSWFASFRIFRILAVFATDVDWLQVLWKVLHERILYSLAWI